MKVPIPNFFVICTTHCTVKTGAAFSLKILDSKVDFFVCTQTKKIHYKIEFGVEHKLLKCNVMAATRCGPLNLFLSVNYTPLSGQALFYVRDNKTR